MSENSKYVIQNTGKYGRGVFAVRALKKGDTLHVLDGKRVTLNDIVQSILAGRERPNDPLQIGRRTYLDLDRFSRAFNHSCSPSAGIRKRSELFALRDIKVGEQITWDYSISVAPTEWQMTCKCGAKNCRGVIGDVRSIPKPLLRAYKNAGAVQRYMKPILQELESGNYQIPRYEVTALEKLGQLKHEDFEG